MQILIANVSKMVPYSANITIAIKYQVHMGFQLAYLDLTLARSKGQGQSRQGHVHFDYEYLYGGKHYYWYKIWCRMWTSD